MDSSVSEDECQLESVIGEATDARYVEKALWDENY